MNCFLILSSLLLQLSAHRSRLIQDLEAQMSQAKASAAVALPGTLLFDTAPILAAAAFVLGHSRSLTAEEVERVRYMPHFEMLHSALWGS